MNEPKNLSNELWNNNFFGSDTDSEAIQFAWENLAQNYSLDELNANDGKLINSLLGRIFPVVGSEVQP